MRDTIVTIISNYSYLVSKCLPIHVESSVSGQEILEVSVLQRPLHLSPTVLDRAHIGRIRRQLDELQIVSILLLGDLRGPNIWCAIVYDD